MKNRSFALMVILAAALALSGCKNKESVDLSGIHEPNKETTPVVETMAAETTEAPEAVETEKETAGTQPAEALSVRSQIATFKEGSVSIEYPILSNLKDKNAESAINDLIKEKATQIVSAYELDPTKDHMDVTCSVISLDRSKGVFAFNGEYLAEDAAHPTSLYYTLTVNLSKGTIQKLSDYADPYTMAGYILSDDCVITKAVDQSAIEEYLETVEINTLWETLKGCDFTDDNTGFPECYSYENQGKIYISVPVPHALGDYFIVEFNADSK